MDMPTLGVNSCQPSFLPQGGATNLRLILYRFKSTLRRTSPPSCVFRCRSRTSHPTLISPPRLSSPSSRNGLTGSPTLSPLLDLKTPSPPFRSTPGRTSPARASRRRSTQKVWKFTLARCFASRSLGCWRTRSKSSFARLFLDAPVPDLLSSSSYLPSCSQDEGIPGWKVRRVVDPSRLARLARPSVDRSSGSERAGRA